MMAQQDTVQRNPTADVSVENQKFVLSEDASAGLATPIMDLIAASVIGAISVWIAIESLRLPNPARIFTAPGLLPFLTSASLLIMALILGFGAITRRRTIPRVLDRLEVPTDAMRSLVLGGIVVVYVAAMHFIPIEASFDIGLLHFIIGSFEVTSVVTITGLLRLYWRAPLWACLTVAVIWIAFLSIVFRMIFITPLP